MAMDKYCVITSDGTTFCFNTIRDLQDAVIEILEENSHMRIADLKFERREPLPTEFFQQKSKSRRGSLWNKL